MAIQAQLEQGHSPTIVRALEKRAIIKAESLESLFRQRYATYCQPNKKGHYEILRSFELHVIPKFGHGQFRARTRRSSLLAWCETPDKRTPPKFDRNPRRSRLRP